MTDATIPDFASLLGPHLGRIPAEALPAFLARLERTAADRYRLWADALPEHAEVLLQCAAREDDIADRIETVYPVTDPDHLAAIESTIGPTKDAYYEVFAGLSPVEQMIIQANAERQGAAAWRGMIDGENDASIRATLEACAQIEETSGECLDALLAKLQA